MAFLKTSRTLQWLIWILLLASVLAAATYLYVTASNQDKLDAARWFTTTRGIESQGRTQQATMCAALPPAEARACAALIRQDVAAKSSAEADLLLRRQSLTWSRLYGLATLALVPAILLSAFLLWLRLGSTVPATSTMTPTAKTASKSKAELAEKEQDAVSPAERQVRAYLHCAEARVEFFDNWVSCAVSLSNAGQSPALNVVVHASLSVLGTASWTEASAIMSEEVSAIQLDIASRDTREAILVWHLGQMEPQMFHNLRTRAMAFDVIARITWSDVFGEREPLDVLLRDATAQSYHTARAVPGNQILYLPFHEA